MLRLLLTATAAGGAAGILLISFKRRLVKNFGGRWYYFICLFSLLLFLVPIKLNKSDILPVRIISDSTRTYMSGTTSIDSTAQYSIPSEASLTPQNEYTPPEVIPQSANKSSLPLPDTETILICIWLTGAAIMMGRYIISYLSFLRKVVPKYRHRSKDKPEIIKSPIIYSPMLIGFFRPILLIPEAPMSDEEYNMALKHEMVHYRRHDSWLKLFAAFVNSIHWFNPISYIMVNIIGEACEYACDEEVVRAMDADERKRYSEMILNIACQSSPALSSSIARSKSQLLRRFELIMDKRVKKITAKGTLAAALAVIGIAAASAFAFADGSAELFEDGGAMVTPYQYPTESMEYNINRALGKANGYHAENDISPYIYDNNFLTWSWRPIGAAYFFDYCIIDEDGKIIDIYNQTEPYYGVHKRWYSNDREDWINIYDTYDSIAYKTIDVNGKDVTVGFLGTAKNHMNDEVIDKMVKNQISFELSYDSPYFDYNHSEYINRIINEGIYLIYGVIEPENIKSVASVGNPYGDWIIEPVIKDNVNTRLVEQYKSRTFYDQKTLIPKNIDGNQGMELDCDIEVNPGEFVILETGDMTNSMPTLNFTIYSPNGLQQYSVLSRDGSTVKPYEPWATVLGGLGKTRYYFIPTVTWNSHTLNIKVSASESDYTNIRIYTCAIPDFDSNREFLGSICLETFVDSTSINDQNLVAIE